MTALFDVVDPHNALRHSPEKLATAILALYERWRDSSHTATVGREEAAAS